MMDGFSQTFLGDVHPWEVDATEHFTVAYYYEKFESATWRFLSQQGADPRAARTVEAVTHYKAELRNRDIFRIETGVIEAGERPTIAHRLVNAASGQVCTSMQQTLSGVTLAGPAVAWDGDERAGRSVPGDDAGWMPTLADVVRPEEADWNGRLALPGWIHRFSTANSFIMAACGWTPEYMTEQRLGLSTFEFELRMFASPVPGDLIEMQTCVAEIGGSSIRFYHRMRNARSGEELAGLSQFGVQLDLDARRPSRIADEIRARAADLGPAA